MSFCRVCNPHNPLEHAQFNNWFMRQRASSRYEARRKFERHESYAESNASSLGALQTSRVLHISMNAQHA